MVRATGKFRHIPLLLRLVAANLIIVAVTFKFRAILPVNTTTAGFAYLIAILLIATLWGLFESVAASFVATLCLNFFFVPPVGTFTIADPQNWVAIFAFLLTSLVASQLSDRAKRRALEATNRQIEMERLYALSRAIMLMDLKQPIAAQIAKGVAQIYEFPAVAIYDRTRDEVHSAGPADIPEAESKLKESALSGWPYRDAQNEILIATVALGGQSVGSLGIQGGPLSDTALHALINLIAVAFENAGSREIANRAEAARHSEEFKSTLLDGLAHEFKTPLTSIKAATSSLLTAGVPRPDQQQELLAIIDQEADRLSGLVTEAIHLARIEAGKIHLNRQPQSVSQLVETTVKQMDLMCNGRPVKLTIAENLPEVLMDSELMQLAIRQLLDNAIKYSPPRSPIRITAKISGEGLSIGVHNWGQGLSEDEQLKIFDKFYRGKGAQDRVAGTGMGLSIAREILLAHGGNIHVDHSPEHGIEFLMVLPLIRKEILD